MAPKPMPQPTKANKKTKPATEPSTEDPNDRPFTILIHQGMQSKQAETKKETPELNWCFGRSETMTQTLYPEGSYSQEYQLPESF